MLTYRAPGVYYQQVERRTAFAPLRTDIAAFLGYAERGPLFVPVKVGDTRHFDTVFGTVLPYAYLGHAVRGFFENGGSDCYVVRVADPASAQAASVSIPSLAGPPSMRLFASNRGVTTSATDTTTEQQQIVEVGVAPDTSPGAWANRISVAVERASMGHALADGQQPDDGMSSFVSSLSGFSVGTLVQVIQGERTLPEYRRVLGIDPIRRQLRWNDPLTGIDYNGHTPIRFETVEMSLTVLIDGQIRERHINLSPIPEHPRYLLSILRAQGRLLDGELFGQEDTWLDPPHWPLTASRLPMTGGRDGLATVSRAHFISALRQLASIDDISIIAAPDVVLRADVQPTSPRAPTSTDPCQVLTAPPPGRIRGIIEDSSTGRPIAGVRVQTFGTAGVETLTDRNGEFTLTNVPVEQQTLLLSRDSYRDREVLVMPQSRASVGALTMFLDPITLPRALDLEDIFDVQQAMLSPDVVGRYRVGIIDPPAEMLTLDGIQTWRARFDNDIGAMYFPWLNIRPDDFSPIRTLPPSGHVAGAYARIDRAQGVHHPPANLTLNGVRGVTVPVDEAMQEQLNPIGVNCIRAFPGRGIRIFGARTISNDVPFRYVNVRRLLFMIEEAIEDASQWVTFESNTALLRQSLTFSLNTFLEGLWRNGALVGNTRDEAFHVRCDGVNNPPSVIDAGQLIAEIAVAPSVPLEFIVFRIGRTDESVEVREEG